MLKPVGDHLLAYVDRDFKPTSPEKAVFVKILYPDGKRVFVTAQPGPLEPTDAT